jgi:AhpD family alkylhydroperoxidase
VERFAYAISRRRFGRLLSPIATMAHSPNVLAGWLTFERALESANRLDERLEGLAGMRAAQLTGCPFCIDIGPAKLAALGLTVEQVRDVADWRSSAPSQPTSGWCSSTRRR